MGNIFRWDNPIMQKITKVGNLILLNILWILCSLPLITMGAATTALYSTVFQYQTQEEDAVFKPFFRAFSKNFKQSTLLWLLMLAILALMLFNIRFLFALGAETLIGIVIIVSCAIFLLILPQLLPQIARFETTLGAVIKNAALLTVLHMPSAFLMAALNVLPVVIFFLLPGMFMQWLPLWAGIYFSLIAYINGKMLLKIWGKHMPQEEAPAEEIAEAAE